MASEGYFRKRSYRSPMGSQVQSVSGTSILWALFLGPAYFWRKKAMLPAIVLFAAEAMLYFMPDDALGALDADAIGSLIWLGSSLAAPLLLSMCYEQKGWIESQPFEKKVRSRLALNDDDELESELAREYGSRGRQGALSEN